MTYGTLTLEGDRWTLDGIPPHVAIKLKHIFQGIPKAQGAPFYFPTDHQTAADLVWFLSRYPMEMSGPDRFTLKGLKDRFDAKQRELETILTPDYSPPMLQGVREGEELRWYQIQVAEMMERVYGLLLGDVVGVGKTGSAIGTLLVPGALPAAVVVQTHLQKQWKKQIERFTHLKVHIIRGTTPIKLPPADVYLFRYSQIVGWADAFQTMGLKTVVYDEIQDLRTGVGDDPKKPIQKGVAALRLSKCCTYRLGLSATPIFNYGGEMWNIMSLLRPEVLGPRQAFKDEWCTGPRVTEPEALGTFLREQNAFLRRTRADVGRDMPKMARIIQPIDFDAKHLRNAEVFAHELAVKATTGIWKERGNAVRELDMRMRKETGIAKAVGIANFLRMVVESGEPVICALWHREVYAIILKQLEDLKPAMYTGSESIAGKGENLGAFLDGETDILLMSLRSGAGTDGIQHRASIAVVGELDWSPGVHDQFFGRVDRDGQTKPVTGYFLTSTDGSDPPMMEVNGLKAAEASGIHDPGLGVHPVNRDGSHLQALVQRYLHRGRR